MTPDPTPIPARATHVVVHPAEIAAEAATIASRAVIAAGGRLDRTTVLAELRLQVLAARHAQSTVDVLRRTLHTLGVAPETVDDATDPLTDPVMRELVAAARDQGDETAEVRLELPPEVPW